MYTLLNLSLLVLMKNWNYFKIHDQHAIKLFVAFSLITFRSSFTLAIEEC